MITTNVVNNDEAIANYYNYKRAYWVKQIGNSYELHSCLSEKAKKKNPKGSKRVVLEDMWDVLWNVHRSCGFQGRASMEQHAARNYDNVGRNIIEVFLRFSQEYQQKLTKLKNSKYSRFMDEGE